MTLPTAYVASAGLPKGPPRALGYIDRTLPGWPANEQQVLAHAVKLGYSPVRVVFRTAGDIDDPIMRLLDRIGGYNAAAVVVPTVEHLGERLRIVCAACDVEVVEPEVTYARARPTISSEPASGARDSRAEPDD
ncbi:hypothetical protein [Nocardia veterana]|uniref:Resolvase-like protein n=1 Tax=Nocardia veterana TaxID=132249 RepID=A0A7X6LV55_9NOCA|nr:hypothetical protein [Nocardia veterana]NKY84706.1 hypothetical protein [Nocardia veterana]